MVISMRMPIRRRSSNGGSTNWLRPPADLLSRRNSSTSRLAPHRQHERPLASVVAMFTQVNNLPRAKEQVAIGDRNAHRRAHQRRFDMRWHVVRSFQGVNVWKLFWRQMIQRGLQIRAHISIGVFVNRER